MEMKVACAGAGRRVYSGRWHAWEETVYLSRTLVDEAVTAWRCEHLRDDARVIVSELVTNAVRADRGGLIEVRVTHHNGAVMGIRVWDSSPHRPEQRHPGELGENGRGLFIVRALTNDACGWEYLPAAKGGGKVVWATLAV